MHFWGYRSLVQKSLQDWNLEHGRSGVKQGCEGPKIVEDVSVVDKVKM